ncbi:MAG TPA: histidine--tRNA ligase [Alphaproteobacteria bacterium]|nr:histidine--tRNA ligase [Alphaproteobacteria bacterium]
MPKLQPVRGTRDVLPDELRAHRHVFETARATAGLYGYEEMSTPIFEFTEVFKRTLGDSSDVVTKEMYTFEDRGGEWITLRPENTAGVARALISGGLSQNLPLKVFCGGPMFRYERPQKGRLRQFHQIDVELLGVPEAMGDVEIIALGAEVLKALGVNDAVKLELNTLGDSESRAAYRDSLVEYFNAHLADLSEDSRTRLEKNPLRILDSKDEGDRHVVAGAPKMSEYLNASSHAFFASVCAGLDSLGIEYELNPHLVRGLDYYCHSAFEFTTEALGAQGAIAAGGRYDGLVETMGGPPTPGVGWAAGVERLAMLVGDVAAEGYTIAVVPVGADMEAAGFVLTQQLRDAGFRTDMAFRGNLSKRLKRANKLGAVCAVLLGEEEAGRDCVTVRDLGSGEQQEVGNAELLMHLKRYGA